MFTLSADHHPSGLLPLFGVDNVPHPLSPISAKTHLGGSSFSTSLLLHCRNSVAGLIDLRDSESPADAGIRHRDDLDIFGAERYYTVSPRSTKIVRMPPEKSIHLSDAKLERSCELPDLLKVRGRSSPTNRVSSSVSSTDGYKGDYGSIPTASSGASWNSQSGLLMKVPGPNSISVKNLSLKGRNSGSGWGRWKFGPKCPCICTRSIAVDDNCTSPSSGQKYLWPARSVASARKQELAVSADSLPLPDKQRMAVLGGKWLPDEKSVRYAPRIYHAQMVRQTSFSGRAYLRDDVLAESQFAVLPADGRITITTTDHEPRRGSFDVYNPKGASHDLVNLSLHSHRWSLNSPVSLDDDARSHSSSDLFEIESLSTTATSTCPIYGGELGELPPNAMYQVVGPSVLQSRRIMDGTVNPPVAPCECYEPSEASVEWSVTTADGGDQASIANFSTAVSQADEIGFNRAGILKASTVPIWRSGDLFGCRKGKSVKVAEVPRRPQLMFPVESSQSTETPVHVQIRAPEVKIIKVPECVPDLRALHYTTPFPRSLAARLVS